MDDSHVQVATAKAAMLGGAGTAVAGGFTLNEYLAVGGFCLAVLGFLVNFYYGWKDDRRKELEHKLRLREMDI